MSITRELIQMCINDDRKALFELYKHCYSFLMRVCVRYAKNKDDAAEYLNTGFLKIIDNLEKYSDDKPFEAWAKRVMINHILDIFRSQKRYNDTFKTYDKVEEAEGKGMVMNTAEVKYTSEDILMLINQLPHMTREVFNLYVVDGYNHKEIGQLLGISEGTSKWHLSNARQKLQEKLNNTHPLAKSVKT